jgi:hypothetical protein
MNCILTEFNLYMLSILYEVLSLDLFTKLHLSDSVNDLSITLDVLQALRMGPIVQKT